MNQKKKKMKLPNTQIVNFDFNRLANLPDG